MLPSLFIAHGAPLLAIENNDYTRFLNRLGRNLPVPKAVVLLSAHWESPMQNISSVEKYSMIYDFGGFPQEMYRIQYPANGDKNLAQEVQTLLRQSGVPCELDVMRGLDHGAWVVLRLLYPEAEIPVVTMSVNPDLSSAEQYRIGKAISALREQDVLIVGSGGTVHNLRAIKFHADRQTVDDWAVEFEDWLTDKLNNWDIQSLFEYERLAPHARLAVPPYGNEHFVPLLYAMGAADDARMAALLYRDFQYGNLCHSVWQFGIPS